MSFAKRRLISSIVVGGAFGFLTWVIIGNHPYFHLKGNEYLGEAIMISLLPGMLAGIATSGNIHIANTWVAALRDFIFYFGVVYFVLAIREKRKAKHRRVDLPDSSSSKG